MLAAAVGFLVMATLVWMSGEDMLIGLMLLLVAGGWSLVAVYGIASFVRAARSRSSHWLQQWAIVWLGCLAAFLGSFGLGVAGAPEGVRISLSRDSLIDAGERVLVGEHPTRAGLYGFSETSIVEDCAMLETGSVAIDSFGFAYCPTGARPGDEHLGGALYKYSHD
jgi:hypothetical protein